MPARPRTWKRSVGRVLVSVAVVYAGVCIMIALLQRSLMYFPATEPLAQARARATSDGLVEWTARDGEFIGWRSPGTADGPTWLICHGNAGSALDRVRYVGMIRRAAPGATVYLLEYPGYGARPGAPSQRALVDAANAAVAEAASASHSPGTRIYILGESLGTGVACGVAGSGAPVAGMLLVTPFQSMTDVASHHYPWLPIRLLLRDRYPSGEWLASYPGPVAIALASNDEVIPAEIGRALYDGYAGRKRLWVVDGARHNDIMGFPVWCTDAVRFVMGAP